MSWNHIACMMVLLTIGSVPQSTAQELRSGPRPGKTIPGPFNPLDAVTERKDSVVEAFGRNPVVLIFAKDVDSDFSKLLRKLDARIAFEKKSGTHLRVAAVLTTDDVDQAKTILLNLRKREGIGAVILAIDSSTGPPKYDLAREAQVTVLLYQNYTVRANYAFSKGKLDDKAVAKIMDDIPKITEPARTRPE